jgi:hypothetical protein
MRVALVIAFAFALVNFGAWIWLTEFDDTVPKGSAGPRHHQSALTSDALAGPSSPSRIGEVEPLPPPRPGVANLHVDPTPPVTDSISAHISLPVYDAFSNSPRRPVESVPAGLPAAIANDRAAMSNGGQNGSAVPTDEGVNTQGLTQAVNDPAIQAAADMAAQAGHPPKHH